MPRESKTKEKPTLDKVQGMAKLRKATMTHVSLDDVQPNPWQPRVAYDGEVAEALVSSIERHGLQQIPLGRQVNGEIQLADGHQRWAAFKMLHVKDQTEGVWDTLPMLLMEISDQEMADIAFESNEHRVGLTAMDRACGYRRYLDDFGVTQEQLGDMRGVSQSYIANALRLLELPEAVQGMIISQEITATHGRALVALKDDSETCLSLAEQARDRQTSVASLEFAVKRRYRDRFRTLDRGSVFQGPEFDTRACKKCEHRVVLEEMGGGAEAFCKDTECWDRKEETAVAKKREKLLQQAEKQGAVPLKGLSWDSHTTFYAADLDDPSVCKDCEHRKLGVNDYAGATPQEYCFDPACYRKHKTAKSKAENLAKADSLAEMLARVKAATDGNEPFNGIVCGALIQRMTFHDTDDRKALALHLGISPKNVKGKGDEPDYKWEDALQDKISAMDVGELRQTVVVALVLTTRFWSEYSHPGYNHQRLLVGICGEEKPPADAAAETVEPGEVIPAGEHLCTIPKKQLQEATDAIENYLELDDFVQKASGDMVRAVRLMSGLKPGEIEGLDVKVEPGDWFIQCGAAVATTDDISFSAVFDKLEQEDIE